MFGIALDLLDHATRAVAGARRRRRFRRLRALGMTIGHDVWLPDSTWIDMSHAELITIGDHVGFGEECMLLAHDAQMDEFLDAARIGRVTIGNSCHIGARTVLLPGVEIGDRTIVGASSVVSRSLPADSVCAGSPARVICSLEAYLAKHRVQLASSTQFKWTEFGAGPLDAAQRAAIVGATRHADAYITGGRAAELRGAGVTPRTVA
jgi:maltose O-acetyltransferase